MSDSDKEIIAQLEAEISAKKAELQALKKNRHLDYSAYNEFHKDVYDTGYFGLTGNISNELRNLVLAMITLREKSRIDGSVYLKNSYKKPKISELNKEDVAMCNDILKDLYPVIEKHANLIINKHKAQR